MTPLDSAMIRAVVIDVDDTDFGKPDPRAFDEFLAETGFCPSDCVYVGDTPGDATAT